MELQELEQHEDDIWQTIDQLKAAYSGVRKEAWRTIQELKHQTKQKMGGVVGSIEQTLKVLDNKVQFVVSSCDAYIIRINQLVRNLENRLLNEESQRCKVVESIRELSARLEALQQKSEKQAIREQEYAKCLENVQIINKSLTGQLNRANQRHVIAISSLQAEITVRNQLIRNFQQRCEDYDKQIAQMRKLQTASNPRPTARNENSPIRAIDNESIEKSIEIAPVSAIIQRAQMSKINIDGPSSQSRISIHSTHPFEPVMPSPKRQQFKPVVPHQAKINSFEIRPDFFKQSSIHTKNEERTPNKGISIRTLSNRDEQKPSNSRHSCSPDQNFSRRTITSPASLRLNQYTTKETETYLFEDYKESSMGVSSHGTYLFYTEQ